MSDTTIQDRQARGGSGWWSSVDHLAAGAAILLLVCGIVLSFAATPALAERHGLDSFHLVVRHTVLAGGALVAMLAVSTMSERNIRRFGVLLFVGSFIALVLLPWFGTDFGKGSVRWYSLGIGSVQPSEFLKTGFAITAAWFLSGAMAQNGPPGRSIAFGLTALAVGFLIFQPDFGQAFIILGIWATLYFMAGASLWVVATLPLAGAGFAATAYQLSGHFAGRIDAFLSGIIQPNSQLELVARAIANGGVFGRGVNAGDVKMHIPDGHSDFILAVVAEEYGLVGCGFILLLFLFFAVSVVARLSGRSDQPFVQLAGAGILTHLMLQTLLHFGVNFQLLPAKGITLPLVSYGGSSLLSAAIAIGALLALTREPHKAGGARTSRRARPVPA